MDTKKVDKYFLFNERHAISFQLQLFNKFQEKRSSNTIDATIKFEDGSSILYIDLNSQNNKGIENISRHLSKEYKKKDFKILNAKVCRKPIHLELNCDIRFTSFVSETDRKFCAMPLKHFSYTFDGPVHPNCYRLTSIASKILTPYLTTLVSNNGIVVGVKTITQSGSCYNKKFSLCSGNKYVYLTTDDNNLTEVLTTLSFFFCNPIEYNMMLSQTKDNKCRVEVYTPEYKKTTSKGNEMLEYLFSNNMCLAHLDVFIRLTGTVNPIPQDFALIDMLISNYVRANYLDNVSKLLLYHSILEKIIGVHKDSDTYKEIHKYLKEMHINIERINDNISAAKIKNEFEEKQLIDNFVKLRNYFIHHLGSKKAIEFLRDNDMLFYLRLTITILILKKLGIEDVRFDKYYHNITVYDDTVEEYNYIAEMFERYKN